MCQQFGWQGVPASSLFIMETFQAPVACTFTQPRDNKVQEHPQILKSDSPLLPFNKNEKCLNKSPKTEPSNKVSMSYLDILGYLSHLFFHT